LPIQSAAAGISNLPGLSYVSQWPCQRE